jgi:hypothetical protein
VADDVVLDQLKGAYGQSALISALRKATRPVTFLVGSALSMPIGKRGRGVPGVEGVIDLVGEAARREHLDIAAFERELEDADGPDRYAVALRHLYDHTNEAIVAKVVSRAVRQARADGRQARYRRDAELDETTVGWEVAPGTQALAELLVRFPEHYPGPVLTTNFDPLLGVAIQRANGLAIVRPFDIDGNLKGVHLPYDRQFVEVIHLHGYWVGGRTLHTHAQLRSERPELRATLERMLRTHTLAVVGYGGWDDVFTSTLCSMARAKDVDVDVLWAFYEDAPQQIRITYDALFSKLSPAITLQGFRIYRGIDCNKLLPSLLQESGGPPAILPPAPIQPKSPTSPRRGKRPSPQGRAGPTRKAPDPKDSDELQTLRTVVKEFDQILANFEGFHWGSRLTPGQRIAVRMQLLRRAKKGLRELEIVRPEQWSDPGWAVDLSAARSDAEESLLRLEANLDHSPSNDVKEALRNLDRVRGQVATQYPQKRRE